ncbi:hypothetical protein GM708_07285 [Vibrio cholerae]|nr:hypothetical protein [Vibrio cholerae]
MTGFDYSCTARRPPYESLPIEVRTAMTVALGGRPDDVVTAGGGFTPGFAATLRRDGRALFVKAASSVEAFAYPAYRREAEVLRAIPAGVPVPASWGRTPSGTQ